MAFDIQKIQIGTRLSPATKPALYYSETIDSTNIAAKRFLTDGQQPPFFILAAEQTAGKGRLGRQFLSPEGAGIYLTYTFETTITTLQPGLLTTSIAVLVAQGIEKLFHVKPLIKWVNDIYLNNQKVCGILTETTPFHQGLAVMVGIGINLVKPQGLTADLKQKIGGILNTPQAGASEALIEYLLNHLPDLTRTYADGHNLAYYRKHAYLNHKNVILKVGNQAFAGQVAGIANNGAIQLFTSQGLRQFHSGEVQKVLLPDNPVI